MPRIAASLGVFGLVVLALGLNIAQFPIANGVVSSGTVSAGRDQADLEESVSPHDSMRSPPVALKPAEENSAKSARETRQAESSAYEPLTDPCDRASAPPPSGAAIVHSDMSEQSGAEEEPECAECDGAEAAELAHPEKENASREPGKPSAGEPIQPESPCELKADSAIAAAPPSPAADSASAPGKPREPCRKYVAGGVYNPLEPDPKSAAGKPAVAQGMPNDLALIATPAEAVPGPPYAAAGPSNVTAGRAMVPIEQDTGKAGEASMAAGEVTRLPSVDNVWPGVPTDQPPSQGRLSAEGYPTTQTTD